MLDLHKVTQALTAVKNVQENIPSLSAHELQSLWHTVATDPRLPALIDNAEVNWLLPAWHGSLKTAHIAEMITEYQVIGIDGSQIYPDRHQGTDLFLLNIGAIYLSYGNISHAALFTQPHIMHPALETFHATVHSPELINILRQQYELTAALDLSKQYFRPAPTPRVLFFDGSLIVWQLERKSTDIKNTLLDGCLRAFEQLYEQNIPYLGYISAPYSKELINIMRTYILSNPALGIEDAQLSCLFDTDLVSAYVEQNQYTAPFASTSPILDAYPPHLRINFVYLVMEQEVVRIEFPAWLAPRLPELIAMVANQIKKGFGYPVACAQAHEQAVVKAHDKELFYALLRQTNTKIMRSISSKLQKKQSLAI